MGSCFSKPKVKNGKSKPESTVTAAIPPKTPKQDVGKQADPSEKFGVKSQFQAVKLAGKGAAGDVWVCRNLKDQEQVAIKFMKRPLSQSLRPLVLRELKIHALLGEGHVNLITAYDAMLTSSHLGLIMEYAAGGNLTSYVAKKWENSKVTGLFLSEDEARFFFRQFITAVHYCHQHCVAHRDLKLDNILLDGSDPPVLKLTDFGFAKTWTGVSRHTAHIGTPVYMSPELIHADKDAPYDPRSVDVWAAGVLLIVMLLGAFPFDHTKNPDPNSFEAQIEVWQQEVSERWYESPFLQGKANKLSSNCRDLLDKIFTIDPMSRIQIQEIMNHPWYNDPLPQKYQVVLDRLEQQQKHLTQHLRERQVDQRLVDDRDDALQMLVKEAGKKATQASMQTMGPLSIVDYQAAAIQHVPLTEAGILMGSTVNYTAFQPLNNAGVDKQDTSARPTTTTDSVDAAAIATAIAAAHVPTTATTVIATPPGTTKTTVTAATSGEASTPGQG